MPNEYLRESVGKPEPGPEALAHGALLIPLVYK